MNTMIALKQATWPEHQRLEKHLAIKDRFGNLDGYRTHLARLAAFYAAAEETWASWLTPVLTDFDARRKAALLAQDLSALGGKPATGAAVPQVSDTAAALGCFYVLEGATLGGQYLLPLVQRKLGLSADHGASYLASYGADVSAMWQRFGAAVEAHCQTPQATASAVAAAQTTFIALQDWLCAEEPL
jgi:heme oxygenase